MTKITLKPGDYVRTEGMTEEQYHAAAKAFMAAGAGKGEYFKSIRFERFELFGWSIYYQHLCHWDAPESFGLDVRELTIDQILGTEPDTDGWIEWHGGECPVDKGTLVDVRYRDGMELLGVKAGISGRQDGRPRSAYNWHDFAKNTVIVAYRIHQPKQEGGSMTIEQLLAKANKHAAKAQEHREKAAKHERKVDEHEAKRAEMVEQARQLMPGYALEISSEWERDIEDQPTDDMTDPTNWKAGDVVECVSDECQWVTLGCRYQLKNCEELGVCYHAGTESVVVAADDEGDGAEIYACYFKWISRPQ